MADSNTILNSNSNQKDIFERLLAGETISANDPQIGRLREEAYVVKELLVQMNNSSDPTEITGILSKILGREVQDVALFTPIHINYGKHITIGKNVFVNFDCVF
ncbi:MAG: sugar O-acetyltransferase, partial [Sphingobacteriales bacterium]